MRAGLPGVTETEPPETRSLKEIAEAIVLGEEIRRGSQAN